MKVLHNTYICCFFLLYVCFRFAAKYDATHSARNHAATWCSRHILCVDYTPELYAYTVLYMYIIYIYTHIWYYIYIYSHVYKCVIFI